MLIITEKAGKGGNQELNAFSTLLNTKEPNTYKPE